MKLGAFSISLNVKDLGESKAFYEKLGFRVLAGNEEMNYYILKNGNALIGIFHGMFPGNILTFNPGWDESGKDFDPYDDIRQIQKKLIDSEIIIDPQVDELSNGPAGFMITDPDGNVILIDQHR